jgi:hypothetical protein
MKWNPREKSIFSCKEDSKIFYEMESIFSRKEYSKIFYERESKREIQEWIIFSDSAREK